MDLLDWGMLIDITMFVLGILTIMWTIDIREVLVNIIDNGGSSPVDILKQQEYIKKLNVIATEDLVQFYFAFNFMCLVLNCQEFLEYHPEYGPLQKIFDKLRYDFVNFTKLYMLIIFMFAIIGHINFGIILQEFKTIWTSILNALKISIGVYDFSFLLGKRAVSCQHLSLIFYFFNKKEFLI